MLKQGNFSILCQLPTTSRQFKNNISFSHYPSFHISKMLFSLIFILYTFWRFSELDTLMLKKANETVGWASPRVSEMMRERRRAGGGKVDYRDARQEVNCQNHCYQQRYGTPCSHHVGRIVFKWDKSPAGLGISICSRFVSLVSCYTCDLLLKVFQSLSSLRLVGCPCFIELCYMQTGWDIQSPQYRWMYGV